MKHRGRKNQYDMYGNPTTPSSYPRLVEPTAPPDHLGKPERELWARICEDSQPATPAAFAVLASALEARQRARECRETIQADGLCVTGRDGQPRAHPLLSVERDARAAWLSGLKALGLEL